LGGRGLARDRYDPDAEFAQVVLDGRQAAAAVRGGRAGHLPGAAGDPLHGGRELRPVRGGAVFHCAVQDDAVVVVGDLGLVAELDRAVDAALADRPGIRVVQADPPGRAVRHCPGHPGPGLPHDRGGALDGDRQLVQGPPQPAQVRASRCTDMPAADTRSTARPAR
jgi:hypothetical protein